MTSTTPDYMPGRLPQSSRFPQFPDNNPPMTTVGDGLKRESGFFKHPQNQGTIVVNEFVNTSRRQKY